MAAEMRQDKLDAIRRELEGMGLSDPTLVGTVLNLSQYVVGSVHALVPSSPGRLLELAVHRSMLHAMEVVAGCKVAGIEMDEDDPAMQELAEASLKDNEKMLANMGVSPADAQWVIQLSRCRLLSLPPDVIGAFRQSSLRPPSISSSHIVIRGVVIAALRLVEQAIEMEREALPPAGETPCDPIPPSTGGAPEDPTTPRAEAPSS